MAGPTIAYTNLFAAGTIPKNSTGLGSQELVYPYDNVFHHLIGKPWRSSSHIFTIDATNNKIDFSITSGGGSALASTITSGHYYGEELAAILGQAMNQTAGVTDITVTFNMASKTFTIAKVSGFLYIKWATGTNKNNSIGTTLQFLTSADSTGALTYSGEPDAVGTGGKYVITTANQKLDYNDGTNRTATIPAGTYHAAGLAAEIKYQMDTTSTVTNFHVNFYPTFQSATGTYRFRIQRASGTITLRTSITTNAIWDTLGYTTGSDKSGSAGYTAERRRIHTEEAIVVDKGDAVTTITLVAVAGINWDAAETGGTSAVTLESHTSDAWTAPTNHGAPTGQFQSRANKRGWAYWIVSSTHQFWRVKFINNDNADGFVQIGALFGGVSYALAKNYDYDSSNQTRQMFTEKQITDQGAVYGTIKSNQLEMEMEFQYIIQVDKTYLDGLINTVADINPFAILIDSTGLAAPKFMWAVLVNVPVFDEISSGPGTLGSSAWRCNSFIIREAG